MDAATPAKETQKTWTCWFGDDLDKCVTMRIENQHCRITLKENFSWHTQKYYFHFREGKTCLEPSMYDHAPGIEKEVILNYIFQ